MPLNRPPVEWRQLCAIAREAIAFEREIDDCEWKARIKDAIIKCGRTYPIERDAISRAMSAVESVMEKQYGPRPVALPTRSAAPAKPDIVPLTRREAAYLKVVYAARCAIKTIPWARPVTQREVDKQIAARIVARDIVASIERCEAAERAAKDAEQGDADGSGEVLGG